MSSFILTVPFEPQPWKRTLRNGNRHFKSDAQTAYQEAIQASWLATYGHQKLAEGPIAITAAMFAFARKASHFVAGGELSAEGRRRQWPNADLDNLLKNQLDALNGFAYRDDMQIRLISDVAAFWLPGSGASPYSRLVLREMEQGELDTMGEHGTSNPTVVLP